MRALVIDDSRAMRALIGGMLRPAGWHVHEAVNGREALAALQACAPFDVALVDWNMPVMNGYEFVLAARADPRWAHVPLVMVTTESEVAQMDRALAAGVNEYVLKPFTRDGLFEKLQIVGVPTGGRS